MVNSYKFCYTCETKKEIFCFSKNKQAPDGYYHQCKECRKPARKKWYTNNSTRLKEKRQKWMMNPENRSHYIKVKKIWRDRNKNNRREYSIKKSYNISMDQYNILLKLQNGVCAICKNPESSKKASNLSVDHCHKTGKIRGLLCFSCNLGLGKFQESADLLITAYDYLRKTL